MVAVDTSRGKRAEKGGEMSSSQRVDAPRAALREDKDTSGSLLVSSIVPGPETERRSLLMEDLEDWRRSKETGKRLEELVDLSNEQLRDDAYCQCFLAVYGTWLVGSV
jgi:hypothetical protein